MNQNFIVGDIVRLIAGSNAMTVISIENLGKGIICTWTNLAGVACGPQRFTNTTLICDVKPR